jgi:hypothetical protein
MTLNITIRTITAMKTLIIACPKSIRLYFFPEKAVTAGWQI